MNKIKSFYTVILAFLLIGSTAFITADVNTAVDEINAALKTGNTSKFLSYLADPVDLTLPGTDDSFSKTQAEVILRKFFTNNKVKNYAQKQSGKSVDGSVFIIGTYEATNAKVFRSYVLIKAVGSKHLIQFVEFEEE